MRALLTVIWADFVETRLRGDLEEAIRLRDEAQADVNEFGELVTTLELLKQRGAETDTVAMQVNVGSGVFMEAKADDPRFVFVDVGLGFRPQMRIDEALAFLPKRIAFMQDRVARFQADAERIGADIDKILITIHKLELLQQQEGGNGKDAHAG